MWINVIKAENYCIALASDYVMGYVGEIPTTSERHLLSRVSRGAIGPWRSLGAFKDMPSNDRLLPRKDFLNGARAVIRFC
jgi:hypothetical protein